MARPTAFQSLLVPKGNGRLLVPYLVAGIVMTIALAIGGILVGRAAADAEALRSKSRLTVLVANSLIVPSLQDAPAGAAEPPFTPQQIQVLDDMVHRGVLSDDVVRVKMWTRDGTIVYTDFHDAIGRKFELDSADIAAFTLGTSSAKVTNLSDAENFSEKQFGELISVYTGILSPKGTPLLFELYFRHSAVDAEAKRISNRFLPVGLGALVILQMIQFPLMWILARRLTKRDREKAELTRYALDATGAVSRRIAGDLHDGVVQDLVAINYSLISNSSTLKAISPLLPSQSLANEIDQAGAATRRAIQSLRSMIVDIYPPSLHEEGLERALTDLLATATTRGLATRKSIGIPHIPNTDRDELLYRVAQEAVRNALQHSHATELTLDVTFVNRKCILVIADNGVGAELASVRQRTTRGHFGLNIIKDVVESAGGRLTIDSRPNSGLSLTVEIPE